MTKKSPPLLAAKVTPEFHAEAFAAADLLNTSVAALIKQAMSRAISRAKKLEASK